MTTIPKTIKFNSIMYYLADEIYKYDTKAFIGMAISKNIRSMIQKKNIPTIDYIFAYIKNDKWIISTEAYNKAKLLISSTWVDGNIPKIIIHNQQQIINNQQVIETEIFKKKVVSSYKSLLSTMIEEPNIVIINKEPILDINDLYDITPADPILELSNDEKFIDANKNIIEIEVRGERKHNKCFFKVKDVSSGFDMPNLLTTLLHKDRGYDINIHYKYFIIDNIDIEQKEGNKKELFLTYNGILKVLFSSRSGNAESFQNWATEKLFTIHMGTTDAKQELASNLIGVNIKAVRSVFHKNIATIPAIYFFSLNNVKQLRTTMNIPLSYSDDMIVAIYGCTEDIERRTKEHQTNYSKLKGVDISLLMFSYIDPQYIFEAETNIKSFLNAYHYKYDTESELVIFDPKQLKQIKNQFNMVQNAFSGHIKELLIKIEKMETKYKSDLMEYEMKIVKLEHNNILLGKEIETNNIILKKEIETNNKIFQLEKKILEQQIQILSK